MKFGQALKKFRTEARVSQKSLADGVRVSQSTIAQLEINRRSGLTHEKVTAIEQFLGLAHGQLAAYLPPVHKARVIAETEVASYGLVWGSPPRDVPEPIPGATFKLTGRWPPGTFALTVSGHSVHRYGVHDGDVIAVQPTEEPQEGRLVIARQGNAYTIKGCHDGRLWSFGKNDEAPKEMDSREEYQICGVMLGIVDGERRFTPLPKVNAHPPMKKKGGK